VHIAHRPGDRPGRHLENRRAERRVEVSLCAGLDLRIAALLDERRQPADLELAPDRDQHIGLLQLQNEARLRFHEVWILVAARQGLHRDVIAANLTTDRRQIFGGRDHRELVLGGCGRRNERRSEQEKCYAFHRTP